MRMDVGVRVLLAWHENAVVISIYFFKTLAIFV